MPCSSTSNQYGGFGGGGAGCYGGGGGGGFVGGLGGDEATANGRGGFSYFNPQGVVMVLDSAFELTPQGFSKNDDVKDKPAPLPKLWKHTGPGYVYIIPPLSDDSCQVTTILCKFLGN
jgi:hypothetical protein